MNRGIRLLLGTAGVAAAGFGALAAVAAPAMADGEMHWRGDVDDTALIYIRRSDVRVRANMQGVRNERHDFRGQLPRNDDSRVRLVDEDGRGDIRLVQQPNADNGYMAVVRIKDPQSGRGHYEFTLRWEDRGGRNDWRDSGWQNRDRPRSNDDHWRDRDDDQ